MKRTSEQIIAVELLRRKRPVTRGKLCELTGLEDRDVRRAIEDLRKKGFPVMSSPRVAGYWLARSEKEVTNYKTLIVQKCRVELETAAGMALYRAEEIRREIFEHGESL